MANVWKIGSRWSDYGTPNSSIISIFRRNNIVFVGAKNTRERFLKEVKSGDYFAIADGYNVVAVARAIDNPTLLQNLKTITVGYESDRFNYDECKKWVVGVRVRIVDLEEKQRFWYKKRHSFCKANQIWKKVINQYENQHNKFSINSYTCTLFKSKDKYKSIFDTNTKYIIPIFQRPYSWGKRELKPFITDIISNYLGKDKMCKYSEPMFIGTMQLSEKKYIDSNEFEQEIIDGQQRLTTLSILLKILSLNYPNCKKLRNLKFNWLETRINQKQNDYLSDFFITKEIYYNENNQYFQNAFLIQNLFNDTLESETNEKLDIEKFCDYLYSSVYFVVIETLAGLSKTLQIFDAINTTGLDLNGGDLFKIRMYEYLTENKNMDETAFERISQIYQYIDEKNKQEEKIVTKIQGILDIYKDVLIVKYDLPNTLFKYGWETFYERLFDTILGVKTWEHFKKVIENKNFEINLEEIKDVIDVRFEWEKSAYVSIENMFAFRLICWSRYSRYWKIVYQFLYTYKNDPTKYVKLSNLLTLLNKLFFVYSIIYARSINSMHSFVNGIYKNLVKINYDELINLIKIELLNSDYEKTKTVISGIITDNARKKNLICCLSAYLNEKMVSEDIHEIKTKLFETPFDVEHINANANKTYEIDYPLQNSIGNLVMLESSINRSIKDSPFLKSDKHKKYKKQEFGRSKYHLVLKISEAEKWSKEEILQRKELETSKILTYIYE
jgi:uncharacterized protein with ParB-like and HNH nuclease domain